MADYVFTEAPSEGALPVTRYEVRCRKCGECYGEESRPLPLAAVTVAVEPPILWPPDHEPVATRDWRREVRERLTRVVDTAGRLRVEAADMARVAARTARSKAAERWSARSPSAGQPARADVAAERKYQTGG